MTSKPTQERPRYGHLAANVLKPLGLSFLLATSSVAQENDTAGPYQSPEQTTILMAQASLNAAPEQTIRPTLSAADIDYAQNIHLAYILSPSERQNNVSEQGLNALAGVLIRRTSVEPSGVVGLDIERDDISLFPFIYWPITDESVPLSPQARQKLQDYLNTGGVILFDAHDASARLGSAQTIANITGPLNLRQLEQLDDDHTLTRSFYLLSGLRGSYNFDRVWVETDNPDAGNTDTLTNVVIGQNNWAAAWAGFTLLRGSHDHELSLRAGVNLVMYALTGDYKSDQLQLDQILDRLERNPRP